MSVNALPCNVEVGSGLSFGGCHLVDSCGYFNHGIGRGCRLAGIVDRGHSIDVMSLAADGVVIRRGSQWLWCEADSVAVDLVSNQCELLLGAAVVDIVKEEDVLVGRDTADGEITRASGQLG